jgi:biopolymer transport protein TolQ
MMDLVLQANPIVQFVLVLLVICSFVSWGIIALKSRELKRADDDTDDFLEVYQEGSLTAAYEAARDRNTSPLAAMFLDGYAELNRIARYSQEAVADGGNESQRRGIERNVAWAAQRESHRLERGLSFLATTGSAAPFVGLFGTVIGIIDAFQHIGAAGTASLAVVAPGIAEALIATAVGLGAAIPATVAYNHFVGRLRPLTDSVELFSAQIGGELLDRGARALRERRANL